jgi:DNA repair protein RecN (Recombination protein N)
MKEAKKGETRTTVAALEEMDMRREEVARMLSGASVTKEARAAAEKLLEKTGS